jgi:hypothetical protein
MLYKEFTQAGGKVTFIPAEPFGAQGHYLFSTSRIPVWTKYVDDFLKEQGLILQTDVGDTLNRFDRDNQRSQPAD